ncbi:MAG: hypothetical protein BJ554DRAFT_3332 [Olpidium bornovanus]|uniref:Uncharacterized protein n=1 Tax=Olpidium bornovanus TaxID=278681 RepID=A0A8H8DGA3_9FUNG|nr:MAG: hypothetical protein BJ554DRAFT_3332 [Olpidium bornovanus]
MRTPERELVVADHSVGQGEEARLSRKVETPTRPEWNSDFASKPSDEFSRKLTDRKVVAGTLGSPSSTPHTSRVTGEVNQLRGTTSKPVYHPKRNLNVCARVDSGIRQSGSPSPVSSTPTSSIKGSRAKNAAAGSGEKKFTMTPGGTYYRVPMLPARRSGGKVVYVGHISGDDEVRDCGGNFGRQM